MFMGFFFILLIILYQLNIDDSLVRVYIFKINDFIKVDDINLSLFC